MDPILKDVRFSIEGDPVPKRIEELSPKALEQIKSMFPSLFTRPVPKEEDEVQLTLKETEQVKRILPALLKCVPDVCLDGLREISLDQLLTILTLHLSLHLLSEAQLYQLSDFLKEKREAQLVELFKEAPQELRKAVVCLKTLLVITRCQKMPVKQFLEAPAQPDPAKSFKFLLSLQAQIVKIVEPVSLKLIKRLKELREVNVKSLHQMQTLKLPPQLVENAKKMDARFRLFFSSTKYQLSTLRKDCLTLLDLDLIPSTYSHLNYFLRVHEKHTQSILHTTDDFQKYVEPPVVELECCLAVPSRLPESVSRLKKLVQIESNIYIKYLQELSIYFGKCPELTALSQPEERRQGALKFVNLLKLLMQKKMAVQAEEFKTWCQTSFPPGFTEFHETLLAQVFKESLTKIEELGIQIGFTDSLETALCKNMSSTFEELEKELSQTVWKESFQSLPLTLIRIVMRFEKVPEDPDKLNMAIKVIEQNILSSETPEVTQYKQVNYQYWKGVYQSIVNYQKLLELASCLLHMLRASHPVQQAQAEASAKEAGEWLVARAIDKIRQHKKYIQRSKGFQRPIAIDAPAHKAEEKKKTPDSPLNQGLLFLRDLLVMPNMSFPSHLVGKADLNPALLVDLDQAFHLVYVDTFLGLMEEAVKTERHAHIPLLMERLLNHVYLAEEKAVQAKRLSINPEDKAAHGLVGLAVPNAHEMNLTTYWWRYLHSSCRFYQARKQPLPEALSFLYQLHHERGGWTPGRLEIIQKGLVFFIEQASSRVPEEAQKTAKHLTREQEKLSSRFSTLAEALTELKPLEPCSQPATEIRELISALSERKFSKMPEGQDLNVHLQRLEQSILCLDDFPALEHMGIHMINILTACQYIYEHLGILMSIRQGNPTYTHNLTHYIMACKYHDFLTHQEIQTLSKVNLRKGSDYPHQEFYKRQRKTPDGLRWLNEAYQLTVEAKTSGSGFVPVSLRDSTWVKDPLRHLHQFVESQVAIMHKIFKAIP